MSFQIDNAAALQHAIKQGLVRTQHWHNEPLLKAKEPMQYRIVILTSPLYAPSPNSPQSLADGDVVTVDHRDMSPGGGVPGAVKGLVDEASQALCKLQGLETKVDALKADLDKSARQHFDQGEIKPLLDGIWKVQSETRISVSLSKDVIRAHWDFCAYMQETLQHAAAEKDCHLTHDSDVVAAGKIVRMSFTALGNHVIALQHALSDVANEMQQLGEKDKHSFLQFIKHPFKPNAWGKIREVLVEIVKMITLIISGIGHVLALVHPVGSAFASIADAVHKFLKKHSHEHGHHNGTQGNHLDADIKKTLEGICNGMPNHIEEVQNKLQDCYARIEQPMLNIEAQLKTHCIRMAPKEAEMAADAWREMREKLDAIVKTHCH